MKRISKRAAHYLRDELLQRERFTVLALDSQRKIMSINRSTPDWKLPGLNRGAELPESLSSLLDSAREIERPVVFPYIEFDGFVVDIHVLGDELSPELVLHDVSKTHAKEQALQQRAHENSLLSDQQAALNAELAELNQELFLRRRQVERASAAKSRFIASMSHEFRSPIASIMGYAGLLRDELPNSENPQALLRASWHLLTLVENLLEQAREGDGNVPLNPTRFSLDRLLGDIKDLFRVQAQARGLGFNIEWSPSGIDIEIDELRLRQVLINLISNALRYTAQGQVNIRARHHEGVLQVRVRDTGQGIAAEDIERMFEPFTRVGQNTTEGTGLGLTITRQLINRMHGRLEVKSKPGVGTEFRFKIPCAQVKRGHNDLSTLSGDVLWVDDDQDILTLYQVLLEDWGLNVLTASSVAQAKAVMSRHTCPVVITDMHLTDGNGLELMTYFRSKQADVEGILISGSGPLESSPQAMSSGGIRAFLQKPINNERLHSELTAAFAGIPSIHAL